MVNHLVMNEKTKAALPLKSNNDKGTEIILITVRDKTWPVQGGKIKQG